MTNNLENVIPKKRGRKSKKELELAKSNSFLSNDVITMNINNSNNENNNNNDNDNNNQNENINVDIDIDNNVTNQIVFTENENDNENIDKPIAKKRGRKPKGGKIIQNTVLLNTTNDLKPNVILHLRCSIKDLHSQNLLGTSLDTYSFSNNTNGLGLVYNTIETENINMSNTNTLNINATTHNEKLMDYDDDIETDYDLDYGKKENDIRDIWKKLKVLEHHLHVNNVTNKKSACFWDTCEFDNPPIYIPKHFMNNSYHVYGCFCSPECAVAHLMNEPIDSSTKFERYYLLNSIYGKIYDYKKNIKPAPNPYYMLEKYYGNLNIQEFRALLKNERLFLVVDKPLTKIMPELHEDNDDFIINNKIIPSNTYHIKKRLNKKQTKTNILSERFGLTN